MEDLYEMMEEPSIDAEELENEYDLLIGDEFVEEDGGMSVQQLGMALGLAEMIAQNNEVMTDPAELFEDFEDFENSLEKVSLKSRHQGSKVPVPAFEQYVYKKCGLY